jgi:hypothetical protein
MARAALLGFRGSLLVFSVIGSAAFVGCSQAASSSTGSDGGTETSSGGSSGHGGAGTSAGRGGTSAAAGAPGTAGMGGLIGAGTSGAGGVGGTAEAGGKAGTGAAAGTNATAGEGANAGKSGSDGAGGRSETGGAAGRAGNGGGRGGTAGAAGQAGMNGGASGASSGSPPGDIAAAAGTPLVAGHSMTRALYAAYDGKLFQVRRASDSMTQDIGVASAGGNVDLSALTTFCSGTTCSVSLLYDQSGNSNDLPQATAANQPAIQYWNTSDNTQVPMAVTVSKQWLRNRTKTHKIPTGAASQTEYFVVHGSHFNAGCCYDYGNMETTVHDDGPGTMSALYFGSSTDWTKGAGNGPWGMTDYENGLFSGAVKDPGGTNQNYPSLAYPGNNIVTVLTKSNGTTTWVLKAGNAASGALNTYWNGALPATTSSYYSPLRQEGGLSLGEGGDGSNSGTGAFSEGVVIADVTSDATDDLIQANLNAVYGR